MGLGLFESQSTECLETLYAELVVTVEVSGMKMRSPCKFKPVNWLHKLVTPRRMLVFPVLNNVIFNPLFNMLRIVVGVGSGPYV